MTCNHPREKLIGTASGVQCRACGRVMAAEEWIALLHPPDAQTTEEARETLNTQFLKEMPIAPIAFTRDQVVVRSGLITGFNPSPYWLFHGVAGWRRSS